MLTRDDIEAAGGAYVRRKFPFAGRERQPGEVLSAEELATIPLRNRQALINTGRIEVWPAAPGGVAPQGAKKQRFAVHRGCGKWDIIEGVKLNDEQLTKEEAEALVGAAVHHAN